MEVIAPSQPSIQFDRAALAPSPWGKHPALDSLADAGAESLLRLGGEEFLPVRHADGRRQPYAQPSDY